MQEPSPKTLNRKIAIITGAAGGIGFGIAKRFVASSAFVAVADLRSAAIKLTS
jgi:3-hydroxybutyrate dehydrogenase